MGLGANCWFYTRISRNNPLLASNIICFHVPYGGNKEKPCFGFGPLDSTDLPPKSISLPSRITFSSKLLRKTLRLANHSFFGFGFQGGAGGKGNVSFKSSTCQTPQVAEAGGVGEEFTFDIGNVDDRQAVPKINIGIRTETELGRGTKAQA